MRASCSESRGSPPLPPLAGPDGNSADTFAWIQSLRDFGPKYVADGFNDKVKYAGANGDASKLALDKEMSKYAKEAYPNVSYTTDQLTTHIRLTNN